MCLFRTTTRWQKMRQERPYYIFRYFSKAGTNNPKLTLTCRHMHLQGQHKFLLCFFPSPSMF